jgi:hypothetical protein
MNKPQSFVVNFWACFGFRLVWPFGGNDSRLQMGSVFDTRLPIDFLISNRNKPSNRLKLFNGDR